MSSETILFSIRDGVAKITLNRPVRLNAFSTEMHNEFKQILPQLESDNVRLFSASLLPYWPDAGSTFFLPRLVGPGKAMGMAMLGDKISADDAERIGLIRKTCVDENLMPKAEALARKLASGPTKGYALIKRALNASLGNDLQARLNVERNLQQIAHHTEDFQKGVKAFKEKRETKFPGR